MELKLQFAGSITRPRVADGLPRTAVPDDDRTRAILLRWNHAFEAGVRQRMILNLYRQALLRRVKAGSLGYCPAFQRTIQLQAEVVMQTPCGMLLDYKGQDGFFPCNGARRFGGESEIPFFLVRQEWIGGRHSRFLLHVLNAFLQADRRLDADFDFDVCLAPRLPVLRVLPAVELLVVPPRKLRCSNAVRSMMSAVRVFPGSTSG